MVPTYYYVPKKPNKSKLLRAILKVPGQNGNKSKRRQQNGDIHSFL